MLELLKKTTTAFKGAIIGLFHREYLVNISQIFQQQAKINLFSFTPAKNATKTSSYVRLSFFYVWLGLPQRALSRLLTVVNCLYYVAYIQYFKKHMW